jgi:hypothetical protein
VSIAMTLKRWTYLLMVVLPLLAVVLALCPAVAQAKAIKRNTGSVEHLVVSHGDCLWSISEDRLGPNATPQQIAHLVELTYARNRSVIGADPNTIIAGQRLSLPPALERQATETSGAAPAGGAEAARAPGLGGSTAGAPTERGSQRPASEAAASNTPATLPALPAVSGVAAVPREVRVQSSEEPKEELATIAEHLLALEQYVVHGDGPYAGHRLLGLGIMLVSMLIGAAMLARVVVPIVRREAAARRSQRYLPAHSSAYASEADAPFKKLGGHLSESLPSESLPSEGTREEAARSAPSAEEEEHHSSLASARPQRHRTRLPSADRGQRTKTSTLNRRRPVGINQGNEPEAHHEWEIDESLRRSLESLPLQPGAHAREALSGLKPHVEEALKTLALVEERRPLSDTEHRQANALGDLLWSIEHTLGNKRGR